MIAAGTAAALALAGCAATGSDSSSADGVVHLTMLTGFTGPDAPAYQKLVSRFNATHPKIQVSMSVQPWAAIAQKLPASWATGQGPDIATPSSDPGSIFNYVKIHAALPLDDAVGTGPGQIDSQAFPPAVRTAMAPGGHLYAVPANMATLALYYNKALFAQAGIANPPRTESEFVADALALTGNGRYGLSLADNQSVQMWPVLQWMSGGDIIDGKGCAVINQAASVSALTRWSALINQHHISPVGQTGADADTLFSSGKAAMEINGPWAAEGFRKAGIPLGIAPLPVGSAGPVTLAQSVPLMAERVTKHPVEVKQFLAWWTSKPTQAMFSHISGFPPARTDVTVTPTEPSMGVFVEALPTGKLYLAGQPMATQIDTDAYVPLIQKIERGADVQTEANAAAEAINSLTGCTAS